MVSGRLQRATDRRIGSWLAAVHTGLTGGANGNGDPPGTAYGKERGKKKAHQTERVSISLRPCGIQTCVSNRLLATKESQRVLPAAGGHLPFTQEHSDSFPHIQLPK